MKTLLLYFSLFITFITSAQDSLAVKNEAQEQKQVIKTDSIIDGVTYNTLEITPEIPNDSIQRLLDHELAAKFDAEWRDELYSTTLFDTIYRDVTDLKYEAVYYPELPTDTLKARLKRLNARTPFNVEYNPQLESVIKNWLKNRHQSMERLMGLSAYYFPLFEQEFDNLDIPLEMKYLAIVESALKPRARSRVGATGLWQFMFATGKQYGLDVSSYVDERSDPVKSTKTAATYLGVLYRIFGDWDLALAAYNSGPGNVNKAIRRSGGYKNYWNIRPNLPRETAGYVPAFLATMYIFEYAEEHGFVKHKPQYYYRETDTVRVKETITFDQVSEYTGVNVEELQYLNPSYKLDIIPFIKGKNYTLRLPREAIGPFVANEEDLYALAKADNAKREKPLPQLLKAESKTRYRVKQGDYLGKIARKYGVRVSQLKKWNGLRNNNLKIGQRLTVYPRNPSGTVSSSPKKSTSKTTNKTAVPGSGKTYKVKSGDSLWSISRKFSNVSVQNLKDWNNISSTKLKLGQLLKVSS